MHAWNVWPCGFDRLFFYSWGVSGLVQACTCGKILTKLLLDHLASAIGPQEAEELVALNGKPGVLDGPEVFAPLLPPPPQPRPQAASHLKSVTVCYIPAEHRA